MNMIQPKVNAWVSVVGGDRLPCIDTYDEIGERLGDADTDDMVELFLLSRFDTAMRIRVRAGAVITISEDAEKPPGYATGMNE